MGVANVIIKQHEENKIRWSNGKRVYPKDMDKYERLRISTRLYRQRNREVVNARIKEWFKRNPNYNKEYLRTKKKEDPVLFMYKAAKKRASEKGIEFSIAVWDIEIPEFCPVLGMKLKIADGFHNSNSPSLDRIDNSKGYIKGNIRVISMRANWIKGDASIEEMEKVLQYMKSAQA